MTLAEANVILEAQSQQDVKLGVTKWVQNYDNLSNVDVLESICSMWNLQKLIICCYESRSSKLCKFEINCWLFLTSLMRMPLV